MINKILVLGISIIALSHQLLAQDAVKKDGNTSSVLSGGVYEKIHMEERKPVPNQFVREADVMWSKIIWRKIDLREKMNHPLYYPETPISDRKSLVDLLMWGIETQKINAYDPTNMTDEFKDQMTFKVVVEERFGAKDEVTMVENVETGELVEKKIEGTYKSYEVKEYLVKELWYFDKQRSVMDVKILGFCPVRYFFKPEDIDQEDVQKRMLFWIAFDEVRPLLVNHLSYNPYSDTDTRAFDDIFAKRIFSSYIYRESNAYNNRDISEYLTGVETLLEADRVKRKIINFEQDLWHY